MALEGRIDAAVLIISDTDYAPLMRKLGSLGIPTMLLSWEFDYMNDDGVRMVTKTSHELLQLASFPILMHEEIEDGLAVSDPVVTGLFVSTEGGRVVEMDRDDDDSDMELEREVSEILSIKNGYGFIKYPNNNLFFNYQDVIGEFNDLAPGDTVEFTIDKNHLGQNVAKNVSKLPLISLKD
jgi:cold shock CspA family protein